MKSCGEGSKGKAKEFLGNKMTLLDVWDILKEVQEKTCKTRESHT